MSRVLCIGDIHEPVAHAGYLRFCQDLYAKYDCNRVVIIGDIADFTAISFHKAHPECPGPKDEAELTKRAIRKWRKAFPQADVTIGNHDARVISIAEENAIPKMFLRDHAEVWDTPDWNWVYDIIIDDVYYFHGTGNSGKYPAGNVRDKMSMSVVMGHNHARAGVCWKANPLRRFFGMDVGCGINIDAYQFAYGKHCKERPILAAGVVLDGVPFHEIMPCGKGERYHKSKFKKRRNR
jgi:hypothetical protein